MMITIANDFFLFLSFIYKPIIFISAHSFIPFQCLWYFWGPLPSFPLFFSVSISFHSFLSFPHLPFISSTFLTSLSVYLLPNPQHSLSFMMHSSHSLCCSFLFLSSYLVLTPKAALQQPLSLSYAFHFTSTLLFCISLQSHAFLSATPFVIILIDHSVHSPFIPNYITSHSHNTFINAVVLLSVSFLF